MKRSEATISTDAALLPPERFSPLMQSLRANAGVLLALVAVVLLGRYVITSATLGLYVLSVVMLTGISIIMAVSLQLINGFSGQFSLGHIGFMAIGAYLAGYPSTTYSREMTDPAAVTVYFVALGLCVAVGGLLLLLLFLLARWSGKLHSVLPALAMIAIFIWIAVDISAAAEQAGSPPAYLIFSKALYLLRWLYDRTIESGISPASRLSDMLPMPIRRALCFIVLMVGGGACAGAAGLIVGLPTLRLRGDYLAIATLGFAEIIRVAITNATPLGGALGMSGIPEFTSVSWLFGTVVVTTVIVWRLAYSAKGRAIMAVREDEIAAAACGIDTTHHKVLTFVIGAFFGGVGGVLYAHYTGFITPNDFSIIRSIEFVVMVTLGGLGSISGAILAAIVLMVLPELLRNIENVEQWRMVIYSLLLVIMMLLRPQGLLGGRELWPKRGILGGRRCEQPVRDPAPTEDRGEAPQ